MNRRTIVLGLAFLVSLALLLPSPALAQSEEQPRPQPAEKKKARKVWTNDDFASGSRPAEEKKQEPAPGEAQRTPEELFAELDAVRSELGFAEQNLALDRQQYEVQVQRWREADNDYDRDNYRESLDVAEQTMAQKEQLIEELKTRLAELERLTAGMKRPAKSPAAQGPPGTPVTPDSAEVVPPGGGPVPTKEPPPPEQ